MTMALFKTYNVIVRHTTLRDNCRYAWAILTTNLLLAILRMATTFDNSVLIAFLANFLLTLVMVRAVRFLIVDVYCYYRSKVSDINLETNEGIDGKLMKGGIRQVKIEDLLGRDEIKISMDEIKQNFSGKVIMITGAAVSIGYSKNSRFEEYDGVEGVMLDS